MLDSDVLALFSDFEPFPPIEPVSLLLGVLLGNLICMGTSPEKIRKARRKAGRRNPHHPSARARQNRRPDKRQARKAPKTQRK